MKGKFESEREVLGQKKKNLGAAVKCERKPTERNKGENPHAGFGQSLAAGELREKTIERSERAEEETKRFWKELEGFQSKPDQSKEPPRIEGLGDGLLMPLLPPEFSTTTCKPSPKKA